MTIEITRPALSLATTRFPADFLWGTATSAYQIEGATKADGRRPSIWDEFAAIPGKVVNGDTGAVACDHYFRMADDVALMADLGLNAYRFSVAWPRILPEGTGHINPAGLDFYDRLVDELLAHGIQPMVTLYHWDLPLALHYEGGWLNRATAQAFADYAEIVGKLLGDRVTWWSTLNEPWCSAHLGYGNGVHAPGLADPHSALVAGHHLLLGHGLAMQRLREVTAPTAKLGITLSLAPVYGADDRPETQQAMRSLDNFHNLWFLDPIFRGEYPAGFFAEWGGEPPIAANDLGIIQHPLDHLGINYYQRVLCRGIERADGTVAPEYIKAIPGSTYTDMGWEIFAPGLVDLLDRVQQDFAPPVVMVTENGAAFNDAVDAHGQIQDDQRRDFLRDHLEACARAISRGIPLQGYFAWSLLDNFEWAEGYSKRFGLVHVDFATQRRTIKSSGHWYANLIASQRA